MGEKWTQKIESFERILESGRGRVGLIAGPLIMLAILALPPLPGMSPEAHTLSAILSLVLVFWFTEAIPMAATALLGPALCIVLGVAEDKKVLAPFASPIIFLFIGSFLLATALQKHGLDRRLSLKLLSIPGLGRSPTVSFCALAALTGFLSMWMSNVATTAVMLPIALGMWNTNPLLASRPADLGRIILLIAFAASIGGLATPVGTPPNLITLGHLRDVAGLDVSFAEWMRLGLPVSLILLVYLLWQLTPRGLPKQKGANRIIREDLRKLGTWNAGEIYTLIVFLAAIFFWIYPGLIEMIFKTPVGGAAWISRHLPEETVGLLAGLILFLLPTDWKKRQFTLEWPDAVKIDWGTIMLFAGGLALGKMIFDTGLAKVMGHSIQFVLGGSPNIWLLAATGIILSLILSEFTSNTASANVMVPLMIAVSGESGVNPVPVALATGLACSFGFLLPVSTGPNAMAYGTGKVPLALMIKSGIMLDIIGAIVIWLAVYFLVPA